MRSKLLIVAIVFCTIIFLSFRDRGNDKLANYNFNNGATVTAVQLYRLCDDRGYHLYTTDKNERERLALSGKYISGGPIGYVFPKQVPGTVRLYWLQFDIVSNDGSGYKGIENFYTTNEDEMLTAIGKYHYRRNDWPEMYISTKSGANSGSQSNTDGNVTLYRIQQVYLQPKGHFYTSDEAERDRLLKDIKLYKDEGIAGYIWSSPKSVTVSGDNITDSTRIGGR